MSYRPNKTTFLALFLIGLVVMYFGIEVYRLTFISWYKVFLIGLIGGVIFGYILFKPYKLTHKYKGNKLISYFLIQVVMSSGFIISSLFLISNYELAGPDQTEVNIQIDETSFLASSIKRRKRSKNKPTFEIEYKSLKKDLIFYSQYFDERENYKSIDLIIKEGAFGFDIISSKKLVQ